MLVTTKKFRLYLATKFSFQQRKNLVAKTQVPCSVLKRITIFPLPRTLESSRSWILAGFLCKHQTFVYSRKSYHFSSKSIHTFERVREKRRSRSKAQTTNYNKQKYCTSSLSAAIIVEALRVTHLRIQRFSFDMWFGLDFHLQVLPGVPVLFQLQKKNPNREREDVIKKKNPKKKGKRKGKKKKKVHFMRIGCKNLTMWWILDGRVRLLGNMFLWLRDLGNMVFETKGSELI